MSTSTLRPVAAESARLLHDKPAVAAQLSISGRVLEDLIREGEVRSVLIGRRRLVPHAELQAYVARLQKAS